MSLLSVIVPVYNAAPWLEACLQSVVRTARGREEKLEVILVDDGSTDGSSQILSSYAEKYSFFRGVRQENVGVAAARNVGISLATGEYIAWIDADDYVADEWLEAICQAIAAYAPDIVVMDSLRFQGGTSTPEVYGRTSGPVPADLFYADTLRDSRMLGGLPNKVIRRELYQGIQFDPTLPILEDYAVILDIIAPAKTVVYIPRGLYYYRQQTASLLHQVSSDRAYFSVEMALRRMENAPKKLEKAAVCAALVQILSFCYHHKRTAGFAAKPSQLDFCHRFIRRHLRTALLDPEFTLRTKVKLVLLALSPKL